MNKVYLSVVLTAIFCSSVWPQTSTPPAKTVAKITSAPTAAWSEFTPAEGGFKILLPGKPTQTTQNLNFPFGQAKYINYQLNSLYSAFLIRYFDFPAPITDPEELNFRYNAGISGVLKDPKFTLIDQKDVSLGGHKGREFVIESNEIRQTERMFIVDQRFFEIIFLTQPKLHQSVNTRQILDSMSAKFYDSFEITKLPAARFKTPTLPADFGSSFEGNTYSSKFYNLKIIMPEDWKMLAAEESALLTALAKNSLTNDSKDEKIKYSLHKTVFLASSVNVRTGSSIFIGAERLDFPNLSTETVAKIATSTITSLGTDKIVKDIYPVTVGGLPFYAFEVKDENKNLVQRFYVINKNETVLMIIVSYANAEDLEQLEKAVQTITFK